MSQISVADTSVKINPLCHSVYTGGEFWLNQNLPINCTVLYTRYRKYLFVFLASQSIVCFFFFEIAGLLWTKHLNVDYNGMTLKLAGADLLQKSFRKYKNRRRRSHPGVFERWDAEVQILALNQESERHNPATARLGHGLRLSADIPLSFLFVFLLCQLSQICSERAHHAGWTPGERTQSALAKLSLHTQHWECSHMGNSEVSRVRLQLWKASQV